MKASWRERERERGRNLQNLRVAENYYHSERKGEGATESNPRVSFTRVHCNHAASIKDFTEKEIYKIFQGANLESSEPKG